MQRIKHGIPTDFIIPAVLSLIASLSCKSEFKSSKGDYKTGLSLYSCLLAPPQWAKSYGLSIVLGITQDIEIFFGNKRKTPVSINSMTQNDVHATLIKNEQILCKCFIIQVRVIFMAYF